MIIKYMNNEAWGYIDGIENVSNEELSQKHCISEYIRKFDNGEIIEIIQDGFSDDVITHNKIFKIASDIIREKLDGYNYSLRPFLSEEFLPTEEYDYPTKLITLDLINKYEFDKIVLLTNQKVYLLNDKGETIERLN